MRVRAPDLRSRNHDHCGRVPARPDGSSAVHCRARSTSSGTSTGSSSRTTVSPWFTKREGMPADMAGPIIRESRKIAAAEPVRTGARITKLQRSRLTTLLLLRTRPPRRRASCLESRTRTSVRRHVHPLGHLVSTHRGHGGGVQVEHGCTGTTFGGRARLGSSMGHRARSGAIVCARPGRFRRPAEVSRTGEPAAA